MKRAFSFDGHTMQPTTTSHQQQQQQSQQQSQQQGDDIEFAATKVPLDQVLECFAAAYADSRHGSVESSSTAATCMAEPSEGRYFQPYSADWRTQGDVEEMERRRESLYELFRRRRRRLAGAK